MTDSQFDQLLIRADQQARDGHWQDTLTSLQQADSINPRHSGVLTGLGSTLIQLGRLEEAVPFFEQVAILAPDSPEAHNNLGVIYTLTGDLVQAEAAYQKTLELDGEHLMAWKNLAVVYLRQHKYSEGVQILAALVQAHPEDTESIMLLASCYQDGGDADSARFLYQKVLEIEPQNLAAQDGLKNLPPASTGVERIARPEHAKKLAALKGLVKGDGKIHLPPAKAKINVAFYGPPEAAVETRLGPVIQALGDAGHQVQVSVSPQTADFDRFDAYVFLRPHSRSELSEAFMECVQRNKRVLLDLDEDYFHLPEASMAYAQSGGGNQAGLETLRTCLRQASLVTAASPALVEMGKTYNQRVEYLPPVWNSKNIFWGKPAAPRTKIQLGLLGTHTLTSDLPLVREALIQLLRQRPDVLLGAGADVKLLMNFDAVPDEQQFFLPAGKLEDYPYMLSNFDLLLFPLEDNPYNQARSDLPLVEAGARGVAWLATPVASFEAWGAGGLFAATTDEWLERLNELVDDAAKRKQLAENGKKKAEEREISQVISKWEAVLR